jgi:hypothetical protein
MFQSIISVGSREKQIPGSPGKQIHTNSSNAEKEKERWEIGYLRFVIIFFMTRVKFLRESTVYNFAFQITGYYVFLKGGRKG